MNKEGQFEISFGMIFSIIIIIATVAVAGYVIKYFYDVGQCGGVGTFYQDFQGEITKAWESTISQGVFEHAIPGTDFVCFANPKYPYYGKTFSVQYNSLKDYINSYGVDENRNIFLYPSSGCKGLEYNTIEHVNITSFFCAPVKDGKVSITLGKNIGDSLVKIG